jgi:hypothetical protein
MSSNNKVLKGLGAGFPLQMGVLRPLPVGAAGIRRTRAPPGGCNRPTTADQLYEGSTPSIGDGQREEESRAAPDLTDDV